MVIMVSREAARQRMCIITEGFIMFRSPVPWLRRRFSRQSRGRGFWICVQEINVDEWRSAFPNDPDDGTGPDPARGTPYMTRKDWLDLYFDRK